ncbi:MAG: hypothetical protein GKR89_24380 [Candidatus Latescibacteria bacterium]|nr:hypothetical protein [Candidatus Latescibacterota bacterium]
MPDNLPDLVAHLKANPFVLGIVRYGRRLVDDASPAGDFDLAVFVEERSADLESIHFHCGPIPVDLSVRTVVDCQGEERLDWIDLQIAKGEILFDRTGALAPVLEQAAVRWADRGLELPQHAVNMNRFSQTHVLDKVRHRLDSDPLLCEFLLGSNIGWLVRTYFSVRGKPYPGERGALEYLAAEEGQMHRQINRFYGCQNLADKFSISQGLTEQGLAPIGGSWQRGELISFGTRADAEDLNEKGEALFVCLFGGSGENYGG